MGYQPSALGRATVKRFYEAMETGDYMALGDLYAVPVPAEVQSAPIGFDFAGLPDAPGPATSTAISAVAAFATAGHGATGAELRRGGRPVSLRIVLQRPEDGALASELQRMLRHGDIVVADGSQELTVELVGTSAEDVEATVLPRIENMFARKMLDARYRVDDRFARAS